jgi:hypothetical protein
VSATHPTISSPTTRTPLAQGLRRVDAQALAPTRPGRVGHPALGLVDAALIDGARAQDAVLGIQQQHPQLLLLQRRHLDREHVGDIVWRTDLRTLIGSKRGETPAQFQCGLQAHRLGIADTPYAGQLDQVETEQPA